MTEPANGDEDGVGVSAPEPVIETFERLAERYGLNRSCGRIYGICYFAEEPLSLDELVAESGYAKSTVSTAAQTLTRLSLLSRRSVSPGGRRVYYEAERDVKTAIQELLVQHVVRDIRELLGALRKVDGTSTDPGMSKSTRDAALAALRADAERIGTLVEALAGLPDDRLDEVLAAATAVDEDAGDSDETTEPRRSPGFYPRWNQ